MQATSPKPVQLANKSRTIAIIIGVSEYSSPLISTLPGAASDARRLEISLTSWGVRRENIKLLTNKKATRREILRAIRVWPLQKSSKSLRLLLFFAGHGSRLRDPGQLPVSVLLPYDTDAADRLGTGITVSDLIAAIKRIRPSETYLFLDACALRVDSLNNITEELPEKDVLGTTGSSCIFCMVAAGLQSAYEDSTAKAGYFTRSILHHLAQLRKESADCVKLAVDVTADLRRQGLPVPEYYLMGNTNGWPLPNPKNEE